MNITNTIVSTELFVREIQTMGSYPSLFECSDGERYVVKDSHLGSNYRHIINELIASHLAVYVSIPLPEFALVQIQSSIIPTNTYFPYGIPKGLGFGSKYLSGKVKYISDIDALINLIKNKNQSVIEDLIKICAFDIWLRNDDRSINNPNLIVQELDKEIGLIAIDHSSIFAALDYLNLDKEIDEIPPLGDTLIDKFLFEAVYFKQGLFFDSFKHQICDNICGISNQLIKDAVLSIPKEWFLSREEQKSIINFITSRKYTVEKHFNILIEQVGL